MLYRRGWATTCGAILIASLFTVLPITSGEVEVTEVSVAMKHTKRMTLLSIKNNGDEPLYLVVIGNPDGDIRFVKARGWDRERLDSSRVAVKTEDRPINPGKGLIILLLTDPRSSTLLWAVGDNLENILLEGTATERSRPPIMPSPPPAPTEDNVLTIKVGWVEFDENNNPLFNPIGNAGVIISDKDTDEIIAGGSTDSNGKGTLVLPLGEYRITIQATSYQKMTEIIQFKADKEVLTFELLPLATTSELRMSIVGEDGQPISNALVTIVDNDGELVSTAVTDLGGIASFILGEERTGAHISYIVVMDGYMEKRGSISITGDTKVTIQLTPLPAPVDDTYTITMVVVGEDGQPISDAEVVIKDGEGNVLFVGKTDNHGNFAITVNPTDPLLPPLKDLNYHLGFSVFKDGYKEKHVSIRITGDTEVTIELEQLPAPPSFRELAGYHEFDELFIPEGFVVEVTQDLQIKANEVLVAGTMNGRDGANISIMANTIEVRGVAGVIKAGDGRQELNTSTGKIINGEDGGGGGSVMLRAQELLIIEGYVAGGEGGAGQSVTAKVREGTEDVEATGGNGGAGGNIVLEVTGGTLIIKPTANIHIGNGGKGGEATAGYDIPLGGATARAHGGGGGRSGLLEIGVPTLESIEGIELISVRDTFFVMGNESAKLFTGGRGGDGGSARGLNSTVGTTLGIPDNVISALMFLPVFCSVIGWFPFPSAEARTGDCPQYAGQDGTNEEMDNSVHPAGPGLMDGGLGESAVATGRDGTGIGKGGNAIAKAQNGGDIYSASISIGQVPVGLGFPGSKGGAGGQANAAGGKGGDQGGDGGNAEAVAGNGGNTPVVEFTWNIGGRGGNAYALAGFGSNGDPDCCDGNGHRGGTGGEAKAIGGKGGDGFASGFGGDAFGRAGDGGDGSDGCGRVGEAGFGAKAQAQGGPVGIYLIYDPFVTPGKEESHDGTDGNPGKKCPGCP